jgi:hypothetical protein
LLALELALASAVAFRLSAKERTLVTGLIFLAALGLGWRWPPSSRWNGSARGRTRAPSSACC